MSPEHSKAPNVEQLTQHLSNGFENDMQIDFHKSDLPSMAELQARADIAAAVQAETPAPATPERVQLTPQQEIYQIGRALVRVRAAYGDNTFDLSKDGDDELSSGMFTVPKQDSFDQVA